MTDGEIEEASVADAVQAVADSQKYAFLIGAGCSAPEPADIPTSGTLIEQWKQQRYRFVDPDEDREDWIESMENKADDGGEYGFWFEQRHKTRGERREFIQGLVEGAKPTLGHIILAKLMSERYVPLTLTPNFDDLLYDPLYQFMGERPHLVNHAAIAAGFKIDSERPTIVKLHGDYLYDNLRNTDDETSELEVGMEDALQRTATEYGLIVVGYSGGDESIMVPLLEADLSEYGIYWCARDPDNIGDEVEKLLAQAEEGYVVEIDGFVSMMTKFEDRITGIELPTREELVEQGEKRADLFMEILETSLDSAAEEEEEYVDKQELKREAGEAYTAGNYERALYLFSEVISIDSEDAMAYKARGSTNIELQEYEDAIDDYDMVLQLGHDDAVPYNGRGTAKLALGEHEGAIKEFNQAIEIAPDNPYPWLGLARTRIETGEYQQAREDARQAKSVSSFPEELAWSRLLLLVSTLLLGKDTDELEQEYDSVCEQDFTTTWNFDELDSWLETADLDPDEREQIEEWIDLLREHKPN